MGQIELFQVNYRNVYYLDMGDVQCLVKNVAEKTFSLNSRQFRWYLVFESIFYSTSYAVKRLIAKKELFFWPQNRANVKIKQVGLSGAFGS